MIEIYAVSYNGQPASAELKGVFAWDGGTIGRGPDNRLPLPDPARHVSRVQAKVRWDGARFWLANVADANPLFVNDQEVAANSERTLAPGDELRLGLYVLRVREASGTPIEYRPAAPAASSSVSGVDAIPPPSAPIAQGGSLDALLGGSVAINNPFADILGGASAGTSPAESGNLASAGILDLAPAGAGDPLRNPRATPSQPVPPVSPGLAVEHPQRAPSPASVDPSAMGGAAGGNPFADLLGARNDASRPGSSPPQKSFPSGSIPQDFDPFAAPSTPSRNSDDPLRDLAKANVDLGGVDVRASDSLINFALEPEPNRNDALHGGTPSLVDPLQAMDPMQLFGGPEDRLIAGPSDSAGALPMKDDVAEIGSHFTPPRSVPDPSLPPRFDTPSSSETGQGARPRPKDTPSDSPPNKALLLSGNAIGNVAPPSQREPQPAALIAAFLEGAHAPGLHMPDGITPELMRKIGTLVYQAVAGAMGLIAARQITKREIGAVMTMIVSGGNNPLKFLPTPEAAMMQILGPHMPGFMAPSEAMQNAFEDLSAHEIGIIAGTRAAFAEVLRRFDPAKLEERLGEGDTLDAMVPALRRAKLWSLYQEQFNQIHREAQDDFDSLFGEAFTKAYEEEVTRFRGTR